MSITNTTLLGLALPVTGTEAGTWGTDVNIGVTTFIEAALAGTNSITVTTADTTLSVTPYPAALSTSSSNYATIICSGAMTAARNLFVPNLSKTYEVINNCTGGFLLSVRGSTGPTTGVTLENGERAILAWNGSDIVKLSNFAGTLSATTVSASTQFTGPGTGLTGTDTSLTAGNSNALNTGINYQANSFTTFGLTSLGSYNAVSGSGSSYYNAGFRNDANSFYLLFSSVQTSATNAAAASFNSLRPFSVALNTGTVSLDSTGAGINCGGSVSVTGTLSANLVTQTSDEKRKKNWEEPDSAKLVCELSSIEKWGSFDWTDGGNSLGIGAQSLQKIEGLDAAVHKSVYGALAVNYGGAAMVATVALAKEVEILKALVAGLRGLQ